MQECTQPAERRTIRLHANMVFDIISKQSGTLAKALAELATNSLDAGSTLCDITLTETSFSVRDNGRGFVDRFEIENFFETFGTPHAAGERVIGRHRRGLLFTKRSSSRSARFTPMRKTSASNMIS
jgi:signal transduction histidine kinase